METHKKNMNRRTFLKGSVAAIIAGLAELKGNNPAIQGIFRPNVVRAQTGEVTLAIQEFAHEAIRGLLTDFEEETGLTVNLENSPASGVDMLNRLAPAFSAGTSPFDVVSAPDDSAPVFTREGWLEPLDDIIPQAVWDDFPQSMDSIIEIWHKYEGAHYRVPHEFSIGYFFTRSDWLTERGLAAPATWDDMVAVGKELTDADNGIWATTDGLTRPALLYVYVAYLATQAGGNIFDFDEASADALQFLFDMIHTHKIFPEAALSHDYTAQNDLYLTDKVAFMRQWPFFQDIAEGSTDWYSPEKIKIELPPAGAAGPLSWVGGHGWILPKFAPNREGAIELIKFLSSNNIAARLAQTLSFFITPRAETLKVFENQSSPILEALAYYSEQGVPAPRPFHPRVAEAQTIVDDVASLYLTKQLSLSDAIAQGKELIAALDTE